MSDVPWVLIGIIAIIAICWIMAVIIYRWMLKLVLPFVAKIILNLIIKRKNNA